MECICYFELDCKLLQLCPVEYIVCAIPLHVMSRLILRAPLQRGMNIIPTLQVRKLKLVEVFQQSDPVLT